MQFVWLTLSQDFNPLRKELNTVNWKKLAILVFIVISTWPFSSTSVFASGYECGFPYVGRLADLNSRSDLKHFVRCAVHHVEDVGWEQAIVDFETQPKWQDGPIYLFGTDTDGVTIFNVSGSTSPGEQRREATDADGRQHVARMLYLVRVFGGGFTTYRFHNPDTEDLELKVSYVHPVGKTYLDRNAYLGAGFYPLAAPGSCHPAQVRASLVYTLQDAENFVNCAEIYLDQNGLRALHELQNDARWNSGPTYLFLIDLETHIQIMSGALPALNGTDLSDLEDSTGYRFVEAGLRDAELYGEGVSYYEFPNPTTGQVDPKMTYGRVVEIGGFSYVLGTGLYLPSRAACRDIPEAREVDTKAELELFVRCAADMVAARGTESFELLLKHRSWIEDSTYIFVTDQKCQYLVFPLDYYADDFSCSLVDSEGTQMLQDILDITNSEVGEGYTSYLWLNPDTKELERKTTYVIAVELDGELVSVGAGLYNLE